MDTIFSGDAVTLTTALRDGAITAEALARRCLDRIAARDPLIGAWAFIDPPAVIAAARAIDKAGRPGPLHGLPIGIKDVILTRDMPTGYNCEAYAGHAPVLDGASVALLRQAGALILGKTETVELASIGRPARTRNPHAPEHTPGGSSSGSAAAVADRQVPVALGTQTGGSIIRPASFCGAWALKPTWGTVSNEGAKPFAPSLDTIGWFARSARDLGLMLDIYDPAPPAPPQPLASIGVWRTPGWPRAEPATRTAMEQAIARLTHLGVRIDEIDLSADFADLAKAHWIIMLGEGRRQFLVDYRRDPTGVHPRIGEMVRTAGGFDADDLRAAYDLAAQARVAFDGLAERYDAVLCPSTIAEAPHGLAATGDLLFNGLLTLLHVPCINLPLFRAANGLPVGLTLTGPRFSDRRILAAAASIERIWSTPGA